MDIAPDIALTTPRGFMQVAAMIRCQRAAQVRVCCVVDCTSVPRVLCVPAHKT